MSIADERIMYITNLMVETLPKEQKNEAILSKLNIENEANYVCLQVMLSRGLRKCIDNLVEDLAMEWKLDFIKSIEHCFQRKPIKLISILNLRPMHRTLILQIKDYQKDNVNDLLKTSFEELNQMLLNKYQSSVIGCYGGVVNEFLKVGKSYKQSRLLHEYYYTIGIGKCGFYHLLENKEEVSLVEYKYLNHFDELIKKENWGEITQLLNTIKHILQSKKINNSKTMYIYKEIFSGSIRYLFQDPDEHREEIRTLNQGILTFEHLFDDIDEIHQFYMNIFQSISHGQDYKSLNPYIRKTLQIIQLEFSKNISLDYISDELLISSAYLSRLFKKEMGITYKKYLSRYRVNKAKELLVTGSKKIDAIRQLVGYQTSTQFVRAFKDLEGMTPSKYRQIVKNRKKN